jgi:acetyltransferase-like isoleucine patch superfamily enzyme
MNETPLVEELGQGKGSAYQQYLHMFVGRRSLAALIKYELLASLLGPMPGALGYLLRGKCWKWLLGAMGAKCAFGRGVVLRAPGQIRLGRGVIVDDQVVLDAKGEGGLIELGEQILVGRNSILTCNAARIRMGDYVSIGPFCLFASKSFIDIGSNVSVGPGSQIVAGGHAFDDPDMPIIRQKRISKGITIGSGVWIGARSIILDGVNIGDNSIIGAGAVVKDDIPPNVVAVGMPAKVLYERKPAASPTSQPQPVKQGAADAAVTPP